MNYAAIMAGGSGSRMGITDVPKQFLSLDGLPIIIHTLKVFALCGEIDKTVVMCPNAWVDYTEKLVGTHIPSAGGKIFVAAGGSTRNETLEKAVDYICRNFSPDDDSVIVTHDAVRPFVTERMISENIKYASVYPACNTVIETIDTVVLSADGEFIDSSPERSTVFNCQTPQSFRLGEYLDSLQKLEKQKRDALTDACSLFTLTGKKVYMAKGSADNIKITRPADIQIAESILKSLK